MELGLQFSVEFFKRITKLWFQFWKRNPCCACKWFRTYTTCKCIIFIYICVSVSINVEYETRKCKCKTVKIYFMPCKTVYIYFYIFLFIYIILRGLIKQCICKYIYSYMILHGNIKKYKYRTMSKNVIFELSFTLSSLFLFSISTVTTCYIYFHWSSL
jgi:hypothetical protein